MARREASSRGRTLPPQADPSAEAQAENQARELAQAIEQLRALKAEDLHCKRTGDDQRRPILGRQIYELAQAIEAARGGTSG